MCLRKVSHRNRLTFRNVQFLGENLRTPIDKKGLSSCLFVNRGDNLRCEGLPYLVGVLIEEFLDLCEREIGQDETHLGY